MSEILDRLPEVVAQLRSGLGLPKIPDDGTSAGERSASELVGDLAPDRVEWFTQTAAEVLKLAEALVAIGAGHIAKLSSPELGYSGLAQRRGMRTPEQLVQAITGASHRDAVRQVRVGGGMNEARAAERARLSSERDTVDGTEPDTASPVEIPWHSALSLAAANGEVSTVATEAIIRGLGEPTADVSADALRGAAERLVALAAATDADELGRLAREERNLLDVAGVAEREGALFEMRGLRMLRRDATGMRSVAIRLDPESEARFSNLLDAAIGPRRGGPRFVDPSHVDAADALQRDPRSTEQIALDTMIQLMELGAESDPNALFPRPAAVRIVVSADELDRRSISGRLVGTGMLEDSREAVSGATLERALCSADLAAVLLGPGNVPFESSVSMRLFTPRQRRALAVRDGGCMFPGCDRPVSWTEAHHVVPWISAPKTEVIDGILLCRHHHLLLHNNGWLIRRRGTDYFLVPPAAVDPTQAEVLLESKSGLMRARRRAQAQAASPPGRPFPAAPTEPSLEAIGQPLDVPDTS
ncbi:hypothetical protein ACLRGF_11700 [Mycetocola zhadangensis]|uniref:hypothetical protein n=1 Tax=Mycetocola zhadangensis TaxID=1164595 RepID=UPI003A4D2407